MTNPGLVVDGSATGNQDKPEAMLVILGAGASHDCLPSTIGNGTSIGSPWNFGITVGDVRPPLTQQLAELGKLTNLFNGRWQSARSVISKLRATLQRNLGNSEGERVQTLESALRNYEKWALKDPVRQESLLAFRFYLRDLFNACTDLVHKPEVGGGDTNHVRLIDRVREWGTQNPNRTVTFVSFNYDLILETAMKACSSSFNPLELEDYVKDPLTRLLKPHGSACWYWWVNSPPTNANEKVLESMAAIARPVSLPLENSAGKAIQMALNHGIDRSQIFPEKFGYNGTGDAIAEKLIPALALPMDGKNEFVWPADQEKAFTDLSGSVTRLLTIGWRGLESHFVPLIPPLMNSSYKALVVAGGANGNQEASGITTRIRGTLNHVKSDRWREFGKGFAKLVEGSEELEWFLKD